MFEHAHLVGDLADQAEVMGDEQIGQCQFLLQIDQQVHHLCLHVDVERGGRLVEHQDRRVQHEGSGQTHPLALATGDLARLAVGQVGGQPDPVQCLGDLETTLSRGSDAVDPATARRSPRRW